jgi:ATP-binding cassette subfamily B protein
MKNEYFKKYLKQPEAIPEEISGMVSGNILFYAFSDFNSSFEMEGSWVAVTSDEVHILTSKVQSFKLSEISLREGRSKSLLSISLVIKDEIVATVWYGQKQATLFAKLKYILEEKKVRFTKSANEIYQEGMLEPLLKKQASTEVNKNKVVQRLLTYLIPYKKEVFWGSVGALGATLISLIPAYLSGMVIDEIVKPFQEGNIEQNIALEQGFAVIGILLSVYLLRQFFIWIRLNRMSVMGEKVARDLRKELFEHIQKLDMDFFSAKQTGSIISRISSDTDRIWDFVAFGIIEVSIALISLISLSFVLISLDLKLGLLMTIPTPFLIALIFYQGEKMKKMFLKCWRKWSDVTAVLSDAIPGMQVVKSFNQENKEIKRFNSKNEEATNEFYTIHESWSKFWPIFFFIVQMVMLSVWYFAMPRLLSESSNSHYITAGTFVSFLLYMRMFTQPIEVIGQLARMLNRASSSAYRIFEVLDTKPSLQVDENSLKIKLKGDIKFTDVVFSYDGVRDVLKGINLHIKEGEMIGLVGPSGSGKSTLTKLMNRFYDVTQGQLMLDDNDIKKLDPGFTRKQIAIVHQDPYLFHGTLVDNIRYGNENMSLKSVVEACRVANAHEFIMGFPDAYDTIVGERGQTLSGGERQRISIARAILNNPKILILDEATSAVDTETERKIQDALDKLIEGRTVIAIAHRLSTLRKANRILVVKKGEIKEQGTHLDLMKLGGEYKKLQDMQTQMHELMNGSESAEVQSEL